MICAAAVAIVRAVRVQQQKSLKHLPAGVHALYAGQKLVKW
jgi:hypothetical protein